MQTTRTIAAWTKSGRQDGVAVGKSHFTVFLFGKPCCRLEDDGYVSSVARHCRRTSPFMLLASFLTLLLHYSTPPIVLESLSRKRGINSKWKLSSLQLYSAHGGAHSDAGGDGWWRGWIRWWVKTRAAFLFDYAIVQHTIFGLTIQFVSFDCASSLCHSPSLSR